MPRRLLRDGRIIADDWSYLAEVGENPAESPAEELTAASLTAASLTAASLILSLAEWQSRRDAWIARGGRRGIVLLPNHKVEVLAADLPNFALIALDFSGPSEGRGYSQARILREHWKFGGELRATGYVHRDQLFFMARCGFNSFELPDTEIESAQAALSTFSKAYQPSNDAGLPHRLHGR